LQGDPQTGDPNCPFVGGCGPPKVLTPGQADKVLRNRTPPIADTGGQQGNCPPGQKEYYDILGFKHCGAPMVSDGKGTMGDDPTHSGQAVGGALGSLFPGGLIDPGSWKRLGLVVLGALLLLIALQAMLR